MVPTFPLLSRSPLKKRTAFWLLTVVGIALIGGLLVDMYADWFFQGDALWSTVLENSVPILLALTMMVAAWRLFPPRRAPIYLSEAAKHALIGCAGMILFSGLIIGLHVYQGEIKPVVLVLQLSTVGGLAGLSVGLNVARLRHAEEEMEEERDRLANLIDGLPAPVVHGRFTGDELTILRANSAFVDVFAKSNEEISGLNLNDLLVSKEDQASPPNIDRRALEDGPIDVEARYDTTEGTKDFQVRVAQALDDGASEMYSIYTDISEQKERMRALKNTREQVDLALSHTNSLIFGVDLETGSVWRQGPFAQFFGIEEEDVENMTSFFTHAIHPEDRDSLQRFYTQFVEGRKTSGEIEYRTNPELGACRWIRDNVHVDDRASRQLLGLAQDITERKKRTNELRRKERRYQAVFDDPNILVGLLTPEGRVLQFNQTAMEYVDADLAAIKNEALWSTPWFEGDATVQEDIRKWVQKAAEGEYVEFEVDLSQAMDHPPVVNGILRPVTDENGEVTSLHFSARDVTEGKTREKELRLFKKVIEQANDAVLITEGHPIDEPGPRITYANPAFEEMTGYDRDEIKGTNPRLLQGPETERTVLNSLRSALEAGESWSGETVNYRKDDSSYVLNLNIAPVKNEDGDIEHWMSVQRDVTDERMRKQELIEAKETAEEASQLKSAMLANMSHELRTPLTSITGFSEMLTERLDGNLELFATRIHKSSLRLQDTLESVLHLSKLEAGVLELEREMIPLGALVDTVVTELLPRATKTSVTINQTSPDRTVKGYWNKDAVYRICRNLLENAIKFTPEGGRIDVRVTAEEAEAQIEVEDSEIGMEPDNVPELFTAFKQESEGLDREYGGSGLGLSIVKRLTNALDGEIHVKTDKGEGSSFVVHLPREKGSNGG